MKKKKELIKGKKNPGQKGEPVRFKGRGLAIVSVILGIIAAVGAIIVMTSL